MSDGKIDPAAVAAGIQARILATLADVLPDAEWRAIIAREVKLYLDGERGETWGGRLAPGIRPLVQQEVQAAVRRYAAEAVATWSLEVRGEFVRQRVSNGSLIAGPHLIAKALHLRLEQAPQRPRHGPARGLLSCRGLQLLRSLVRRLAATAGPNKGARPATMTGMVWGPDGPPSVWPKG